jgi:hypothetical protein
MVHGSRDLTGLHSSTKNLWGSIQHRHDHSYTPRDFSGLHSDMQNPWGSINHRRRRFHPPRDHLFSSAEQPQPLSDSHSDSHPQSQLNRHSQSLSPAQLKPTHIFQIIQHSHGISPTKPKITNTIPATPTKIQKNTCTARCACGNIIPAYSSDRRSWRSMDTRDTRFRRRFRSLWDRERGRSHVWGGALVTVSLGSLHHDLCGIRGPGRVSESFVAMFSHLSVDRDHPFASALLCLE